MTFLESVWSSLMRRLGPHFLLARIYLLPVPSKPIGLEAPGEMSVRQAKRDELHRAANELPDQLHVDAIDSALRRGDICVAAFHSSRLVGFAWGSMSTAPHTEGLWVRVAAPYIYGYKSYVLPEYRGQRLSATLIRVRDEILRAHGRRLSVGFVETHNYPSLEINKHLGSELVGYAGYVKLFNRYFPFRTPGVRPHTFEFIRAAPIQESDHGKGQSSP